MQEEAPVPTEMGHRSVECMARGVLGDTGKGTGIKLSYRGPELLQQDTPYGRGDEEDVDEGRESRESEIRFGNSTLVESTT